MRAPCLLLVLGLAIARPGVAAPAERVVLPLTLNEVPKGDVLALVEGADVLLRVRDLEGSGLAGFTGRRETLDGEEWVSLASLAPAVSFRIDLEAVALVVTVPPDWLARNILDATVPPPPDLVFAAETSLFVNYAVSEQDFKTWSGFAEAGFSLGGNLLYGGVTRNPDGGVVRGLTNLTRDDRLHLRRYVLGDTYASAGSLGGALFLAGISVSRSFDLDPYFDRYPTASLSGAATTPSTVDVYVNGSLVKSQEIGPGPFQITNLILPAGSGTTRVVVRDVFGRERELVSGFYASTAVLAEGLSAYTYNLGFRRDNLATASWDYGSLSFLGVHRYGFSDRFTGELRLEADGHLVSLGPGFAWRLPVGEMEGSLAVSRDGGRNGGAASLAYRYVGQPVNGGLALRALSPHYAVLGLSAGQDRPRWDGSAFLGLQLGRSASLTLQYSVLVPRDAPSSQRASISGTSGLSRRLSLLVSYSRVFHGAAAGNEAFVGLSCFLGSSTTALASYGYREGLSTGSLDVQRSLPLGTGFGYRVSGTVGDGASQAGGQVQYNAPFGRYEASIAHAGGSTTSTLAASGGIVLLGGNLLPTRPVEQSFALLRVPGVAGVRGYASNQEIGRTDSSGDLLIPNLIPYYGNRIGIADRDVPMEYEIDAVERTVATPLRGGAVISFPVRRVTGVTGRVLLAQEGQETIPAYGELSVTGPDGKAQVSPIGGDGGFYLENLPAGRHPAALEYKDTVCPFALVVPEPTSPILNLGTVRCAVPPEGGKNR